MGIPKNVRFWDEKPNMLNKVIDRRTYQNRSNPAEYDRPRKSNCCGAPRCKRRGAPPLIALINKQKTHISIWKLLTSILD